MFVLNNKFFKKKKNIRNQRLTISNIVNINQLVYPYDQISSQSPL